MWSAVWVKSSEMPAGQWSMVGLQIWWRSPPPRSWVCISTVFLTPSPQIETKTRNFPPVLAPRINLQFFIFSNFFAFHNFLRITSLTEFCPSWNKILKLWNIGKFFEMLLKLSTALPVGTYQSEVKESRQNILVINNPDWDKSKPSIHMNLIGNSKDSTSEKKWKKDKCLSL